MRWNKASNYHFRSEPAGYLISAARVKGKFKYTAWTPEGEIMNVFDNPKEAREACEKRHEKHKAIQAKKQ